MPEQELELAFLQEPALERVRGQRLRVWQTLAESLRAAQALEPAQVSAARLLAQVLVLAQALVLQARPLASV